MPITTRSSTKAADQITPMRLPDHAPPLSNVEYHDFMQGNTYVKFSELKEAATHAKANPNDFLARMAADRAKELWKWAEPCTRGDVERTHSALAATTTTTTTNPTPESRSDVSPAMSYAQWWRRLVHRHRLAA